MVQASLLSKCGTAESHGRQLLSCCQEDSGRMEDSWKDVFRSTAGGSLRRYFIWDQWGLHAFQSVGEDVTAGRDKGKSKRRCPGFSSASDFIQLFILHIVESISC